MIHTAVGGTKAPAVLHTERLDVLAARRRECGEVVTTGRRGLIV
jgi:hypothetical protein